MNEEPKINEEMRDDEGLNLESVSSNSTHTEIEANSNELNDVNEFVASSDAKSVTDALGAESCKLDRNDIDQPTQPYSPYEQLQQEWNTKQFNRGGRIELYLNEQQEIDFKKARTFSSAAMICAVVSLFIGGVLLSAVGLICAYVSYRRVKKHLGASGSVGMFANAMKRTAVTSAMFCGFSLGLNAFAIWQMMPYVTEMLNSESMLLTGLEETATNSTWG